MFFSVFFFDFVYLFLNCYDISLSDDRYCVNKKDWGEREKMTKLSPPMLSHILLVAIVHYIDVLD
jgi:hypothetical protein